MLSMSMLNYSKQMTNQEISVIKNNMQVLIVYFFALIKQLFRHWISLSDHKLFFGVDYKNDILENKHMIVFRTKILKNTKMTKFSTIFIIFSISFCDNIVIRFLSKSSKYIK